MVRPRTQPDATPFEREESLGFITNHLARLFARALDRALSRHGVALGQFGLLLVLWEEDGLTQTEIARRLDIEQPTAANTLQRMHRDGLVIFGPHPHNCRQVLVHLTERGRALRAPLTAEARAVNARAAATLTSSELKSFAQIVTKMRAAFASKETAKSD